MIIAPVLEQSTIQEPRIHTWTREEYYRLAELGLFDGRRVELIEGVIYEMTAIGVAHMTGVSLAQEVLSEVFGSGWVVRVQGPLSLGTSSDPEPDIAVVVGKVRDYRRVHPTTAALVVEVSDTTLEHDIKVKASLYAKANLLDYWIVNIPESKLEIRRNPRPDSNATFGFDYTSIDYFRVGDFVSPLARPDVQIAVADLMP
jgi:Uma2 family endonuclease